MTIKIDYKVVKKREENCCGQFREKVKKMHQIQSRYKKKLKRSFFSDSEISSDEDRMKRIRFQE